MKHALAGVLVVTVAALAALGASCSIRHRSDQFTCDTNADCESGLVCDDGVCVTAGGGGGTVDAPRPIDAPKPGPDANLCPAPCTTCNLQQKTCTVNCQLTSCTNTVTCPAGYKCDIQCNADNACRNGVNCQTAASCAVTCSGKSSCQGVACGPGPCDVACSGPSSCKGVACGSSCACDVTCTGNQSCSEGIQCRSFACRSTNSPGCTSVPAFCHSCN